MNIFNDFCQFTHAHAQGFCGTIGSLSFCQCINWYLNDVLKDHVMLIDWCGIKMKNIIILYYYFFFGNCFVGEILVKFY